MKKVNIPIILITITFLLLFTGCKKFDLFTKTIFSKTDVHNITSNSAVATTEILEIGEYLITYGHCYSTYQKEPTISNAKNTVLNGLNAELGSFSEAITGLVPNTVYYIRAYSEEDTIRYSNKVHTFRTY